VSARSVACSEVRRRSATYSCCPSRCAQWGQANASLRSRHTRSMGLRSGPYGGKHTTRTFAERSRHSAVWAPLFSGSRSLQLRQFQKEPLPAYRFHGAIDVEPCANVLDGTARLYARRLTAPAANRQEAEPAFVWAEHPDGTHMVRRYRLLESGLTGRLEARNGLRFFGVRGPRHLKLGLEARAHHGGERLVLDVHPVRSSDPLAQFRIRGEAFGPVQGLLQAGEHVGGEGDGLPAGT
jgi:hypothetical protein